MNFSDPQTLKAAIPHRPASIVSLAAGAEPAITVEVRSRLADVAAEWRAFEAEAEGTVFQRFARLAHWHEHVGAAQGTEPVIVMVRDAGVLLFVLPLAAERHGAVRKLTFLGSGLSDYNAPLVSPAAALTGERFRALWPAVLNALKAAARFDMIELRRLPPMVGSLPNPLLALPTVDNPNRSYATALGTDWEDYHAAKRSAATRKRERRHLKRLAEEGDLRFRDITEPEEIEATLDVLFAQKKAAFERMGAPDIFDRPGHRDFIRAFAADTSLSRLIHVARLEVGGAILAASLGLIDRGRYHLVLSSYDGGPLSKFGPGRALLHYVLEWAIGRGLTVFDFTIGDEPYKRDWCELEQRLFDHVSGVTLLGRAVALWAETITRSKRAIKQNPMLWQAAQRLRRSFGRRPAVVPKDAEE